MDQIKLNEIKRLIEKYGVKSKEIVKKHSEQWLLLGAELGIIIYIG